LAEGEVHLAVDEGVLVKTGLHVLVSVRQALGGADLPHLRTRVAQEFLMVDEREQNVRSVMKRLETGFLQRFAGFQHE
jgi:F-type H+-transporting ATPase subunit epsilon